MSVLQNRHANVGNSRKHVSSTVENKGFPSVHPRFLIWGLSVRATPGPKHFPPNVRYATRQNRSDFSPDVRRVFCETACFSQRRFLEFLGIFRHGFTPISEIFGNSASRPFYFGCPNCAAVVWSNERTCAWCGWINDSFEAAGNARTPYSCAGTETETSGTAKTVRIRVASNGADRGTVLRDIGTAETTRGRARSLLLFLSQLRLEAAAKFLTSFEAAAKAGRLLNHCRKIGLSGRNSGNPRPASSGRAATVGEIPARAERVAVIGCPALGNYTLGPLPKTFRNPLKRGQNDFSTHKRNARQVREDRCHGCARGDDLDLRDCRHLSTAEHLHGGPRERFKAFQRERKISRGAPASLFDAKLGGPLKARRRLQNFHFPFHEGKAWACVSNRGSNRECSRHRPRENTRTVQGGGHLKRVRVEHLPGERFGRLVVVGPGLRDGRGRASWRCKCDCGRETLVSGIRLRLGQKRSCGCLQRESREKHFRRVRDQHAAIKKFMERGKSK